MARADFIHDKLVVVVESKAEIDGRNGIYTIGL
jgi:hypothetical protein